MNLPANVGWNEKQLSLIRRTVAADCDRDSKGANLALGEFDWFASICRSLQLDPLKRQCYAFVFNKDKPQYRRMVPVVAIAGYRAIAERTGCYRPDDQLPVFVYDEKLKNPQSNPKGIVSVTARVFKYVQGEWFAVPAEADWEAYAPLIEHPEGGYEMQDTGEKWPDGNPKKKKVAKGKITMQLDPNKERWRVDPKGMLAKCAEALALRKAWPDNFSGTYAEGELDKAHTLELTATELADAGEQERRLEQIGGGSKILMDWMDGEPLSPVPVGQLGDQAIAFIRKNKEEPSSIISWQERNRHGLQQFWAMDKDAALAVKQEIEKATAA